MMVTVARQRGLFIEWRLVKALATALMVLMLGAALAFLLRGTPYERGTQLLVEAFSKRRLIEPRLSGGFKGGVFNSGEKSRTGIGERDLQKAEELIEDAVNDKDPKSLLAYGRLLASTGTNNTEALTQLRKAVAAEPERAEPHNDLGVCLMEDAKLEDALEEFNAALKSKPDMPEALFNRGLCYEGLLLRDAANEDFTRLFEVERDRSWAGETKKRQQAVSVPIEPLKQQTGIAKSFDDALDEGNIEEAKRIANDFLEIVLKHAYADCPKEYLQARVDGNLQQADRALAQLRLIGECFVETNGDRSFVDLANYLSSLPPDKLQSEASLINRHFAAEAGMAHRGTESQATFQELAKQFEQSGNHLFHFFSAQDDATCDYISRSYKSGFQKLTDCLKIIDKDPWPYRKAQVYANLGLTCTRMAQDALGLKYCEQAMAYCGGAPLLQSTILKYMAYAHLKGFHEWNAPVLQSTILQYMANAYAHLGDIQSGLAYLRKSTRLMLDSSPLFGDLTTNTLLTADIYSLINNHPLSMLYAKQALAFAEKRKIDPAKIMEAASFVAVEHARLNQMDQAEEQIQRVFAGVEGVQPWKKSFIQYIALMRAAEIASLQNNTGLALENYDKAEALAKNSEEKTLQLMDIMRGRAEAYAQAKDFEHACEDLKSAISLIEFYSDKISDSSKRSVFLDITHDVFDQVIALNIQAFSRGEEAFDFSEQSRARTLLNDLSSQPDSKANQSNSGLDSSPSKESSKPMKLSEVQAALPDDLRLITYSVTDKGTFIFLVTRSGFEWAESKVATDELDRLAQAYISGIKNKGSIEEISQSAHKLYSYLIGPVAKKINDGKRLCIVPDKALNLIPFEALIDDSDKYLVESFRLTYAPSATVLARCMEESRSKGSATDEKILAVGNPLINRDRFPSMKDLPDAAREARESAALYTPADRRVVLVEGDATKERVRAEFADCDIAHLSLHCLVNEKTPLLAALMLTDPNRNQTPGEQAPESDAATGTQDDGMLYLKEIYSWRVPKTKLVILSACDSALGQFYRGEGIVSLVRPFLALRVPSVIASLWSVDSPATASLMVDFHRERKGNNPGAGDALRAAQLRMLRGSSYQHPYYWAAFIVVGSNG